MKNLFIIRKQLSARRRPAISHKEHELSGWIKNLGDWLGKEARGTHKFMIFIHLQCTRKYGIREYSWKCCRVQSRGGTHKMRMTFVFLQ